MTTQGILQCLVMVMTMYVVTGQFGREPPKNLSMDQIILRVMGGMEAVANRLTLPDGLVLAELDMFMNQKQYEALYPKKQKKKRKKRKAIRGPILRWPNGEVPYYFSERGYNDVDKYFVRVAMREWEKYTCLRFKERTNEQNYVLFQDGYGCNSQLGMVGGPQVLNLDKNGCRFKGLYLHEIAHAVGLVHEHQRPIRDSYIDIKYENVQPVMRQWFNKYPDREIDSFGVDYEYSSVMHYGVTAFSADGRSKTIRPKPQFRDREEEIGRVYQKELSFTDIETVSKMYGCADHCGRNAPKCNNRGFLDQNCQCICPDGTKDCQEGYPKPPSDCVNQNGKDWQCNVWATQGECARNKNYMYANCRRACGLCGDAFEQHPEIGNQCRNFYDDDTCENWKKLGDCVVNEQWMKKNCKKTCGMCVDGGILPGTSCPNAYTPEAKCYEWALKGECGANPRWMPYNCAKACRTCTGGDDDGTIFTNKPPLDRSTRPPVVTTRRPNRRTTRRPTLRTTTPPKPETDCYDRYNTTLCQEFERKYNFCAIHPTYMQANCEKTCVCDKKEKGKESAYDRCKDKAELCQVWADNGHCVKNPSYMWSNCQRACRRCTAGLRETVDEVQRDAGYTVTEETKGNSNSDPGNGQPKLTLHLTLMSVILIVCNFVI